MIRGTTAQFKFNIPCTKSELEWATIKFWQPNNPNKLLPITKSLSNCHNPEDSKELYISLTAEETSRFSDKYKAMLQFRAQHANSGTIFGIKTQQITVYPMSDEILKENPTMPDEDENGFIILDGETIATE